MKFKNVAAYDTLQQYLKNYTLILLASNLIKQFSDTFQAPVTYSNRYIYHHHTTVVLL